MLFLTLYQVRVQPVTGPVTRPFKYLKRLNTAHKLMVRWRRVHFATGKARASPPTSGPPRPRAHPASPPRTKSTPGHPTRLMRLRLPIRLHRSCTCSTLQLVGLLVCWYAPRPRPPPPARSLPIPLCGLHCELAYSRVLLADYKSFLWVVVHAQASDWYL